MAENKIPTKREWKSPQRKSIKKNSILRTSKYLEYLNANPGLTYKDIAEKFNISTARVCRTIPLVRKLPREIIDYLGTLFDPEKISYFTERRLRPLAKLESDTEKIAKFHELKDKALQCVKLPPEERAR